MHLLTTAHAVQSGLLTLDCDKPPLRGAAILNTPGFARGLLSRHVSARLWGRGCTDDEIAIVLGHKISDAPREQVSQAMAGQTAISVGATLFGLGADSASVANAGYEVLIASRFSRTHESETDRLGLELTARRALAL